MRDRLIELISESNAKNLNVVQMLGFEKLILAEDLLANGVIVPPCKVGQTLYVVAEVSNQIVECFVIGFYVIENKYTIITDVGMICNNSVGKTTFLTREEAERALRATDNNVGDKTEKGGVKE